MAIRLFYFFDDQRLNFLLYFTITTFVLALGPEFFMPATFSKTRNVPVIKAPAGDISGIQVTTRDDRLIYAYRGIPYAQPPVGNLRFLRPQLFDDRLEGVHDGSAFSKPCMHPFKLGSLILKMGSEDCLSLNVHVPPRALDKPQGLVKELLPVMVWVHGGGFVIGDATDLLYGPEYLMDRDVILVTIQYRLGSLGFFSLGTDQVAGNQGLWDQREALKWVQRNIESFGGDPQKVTLFGESAGGMSVASHLMSDASKGLFHKAIIQSGPLHNSFLMIDREIPLTDLHVKYAEVSGCQTKSRNSEETLQCLQSLPAENFLDNLYIFDECNSVGSELMAFPAVWRPQADFDHSSKPFFMRDFVTAVSEGKFASDVPLMIGFNREDGLINTGLLSKRPGKVKQLKDDWDRCLANNIFGRRFDEQKPVHKKLSDRVTDFYFKGNAGAKFNFTENFETMTNMYTDSAFGQGSDRLVKAFVKSQKSPVYFYRFDHLGAFSGGDVFSSDLLELITLVGKRALGLHGTKSLGVSHLDDVFYLFGGKLPNIGPEDLDMSRAMVDMWANFAATGNPTPVSKDKSFVGKGLSNLKNAWPKAGNKDRACDYVRLDNAKVILECDTQMDERFGLWRELMKELKL